MQLRRRDFEVENRRIREELMRERMASMEARAARELAEARAELLDELRAKREELEQKNRALETLLAALRLSEERFRVAFQQAPYGIVFRDPNEGVLELNASFARLVGRTEEELRGKPLDDLLDPEERARLGGLPPEGRSSAGSCARTARSRGRAARAGSCSTRTAPPSSSSRWSRTPEIRREAEHARLEAQLHHSQRMEAAGRLASGIAHDFNNVLAVIRSFADLAERRAQADEQALAWLGSIRSATDRGASLTRQLLLFARKDTAPAEALDLQAAVHDVMALLGRTLGDDLRVSSSVPEGLPHVRLSRSQLDQVVMNLAVNARDAMPQGGELRIGAERMEICEATPSPFAPPPGVYVRLRVTDTGTGVPPHVALHIFEPFFTTKESGRGTGLGLAIVYGIVTKAGGTIAVDTAPGAGTTFELLLPTAETATVSVPPPAVTRGPAAAGESVLLVEDQEMIRQVASVILEEHGFRVSAAEDAEAALGLVDRAGVRPDVLVTDVLMPGKTGVDLARELDRRFPGLPVVFISGYTDDRLAGYREDDPRVMFLPKPFDSDTLLGAVAAVLVAARAPVGQARG